MILFISFKTKLPPLLMVTIHLHWSSGYNSSLCLSPPIVHSDSQFHPQSTCQRWKPKLDKVYLSISKFFQDFCPTKARQWQFNDLFLSIEAWLIWQSSCVISSFERQLIIKTRSQNASSNLLSETQFAYMWLKSSNRPHINDLIPRRVPRLDETSEDRCQN